MPKPTFLIRLALMRPATANVAIVVKTIATAKVDRVLPLSSGSGAGQGMVIRSDVEVRANDSTAVKK